MSENLDELLGSIEVEPQTVCCDDSMPLNKDEAERVDMMLNTGSHVN